MKRIILLGIIAIFAIQLTTAATLTCTQTTEASLDIPQFSSGLVEIQCAASGGTVGNIQITPIPDPGTGLTIVNSKQMTSSIGDSSSDTAKWTITGGAPNTYSLSFTLVSDGTESWSGASSTLINVPAAAQLTVEYILPPSIFTPTVETLDYKITNIGGTTAQNVRVKLNDNSVISYQGNIVAGAQAALSWTNETGFNESGSYTTYVYVGDTLHDSVVTTVNSASDTNITAETGWTLFSLSEDPSDKSVTTVLADIIDNTVIVWGYNESASTGNEWISYDPDLLDPTENDLKNFDIYSGYWLRTDEDVSLSIDGDTFGNTQVSLFSGWNLVGMPSTSNLTVETTISSFVDKLDIMWGYDTTEEIESQRWKSYDPDLLDPTENDLQTLTIGQGYWFRLTSATTWNITN